MSIIAHLCLPIRSLQHANGQKRRHCDQARCLVKMRLSTHMHVGASKHKYWCLCRLEVLDLVRGQVLAAKPKASARGDGRMLAPGSFDITLPSDTLPGALALMTEVRVPFLPDAVYRRCAYRSMACRAAALPTLSYYSHRCILPSSAFMNISNACTQLQHICAYGFVHDNSCP